MFILIGLIIISPLIYNTKQQKRQHYDKSRCSSKSIRMDNSYPYHNNKQIIVDNEKGHSLANEISIDYKDDQINKKCNSETDHDSFKLSNTPVIESVMEYNIDSANSDLDLNFDPDLFDVSSCVLTNYFNLYPDELERILNEGSDHLNKNDDTVEDKIKSKSKNESMIENTSKNIDEFTPVGMNSLSSVEENLPENAITNIKKQSLTIFNEQNVNEKVNKINIFAFTKHIEQFKRDISQYIKCNVLKSNCNFYLQRLEEITNSIDLLDKLKLDLNGQKRTVFSNNDQNLEEILRLVFIKFGNNISFDKETYYSFVKEFKKSTHEIIKSHYLYFNLLSFEEKILMPYYVFMKLYRYANHIPEILILGRFVTDKYLNNTSFILRFINLFIEKIGLEENKVFVKFLLCKAITCSNRENLDFFLVPEFYIKCHINHKNFQFFSWEIHLSIRQRIKQKTKENKHYELNNKETVHIKVALLLFLYQHIIFLKCHLVTIEDINTLIYFGKRVMRSKECVICIFDDFIRHISTKEISS